MAGGTILLAVLVSIAPPTLAIPTHGFAQSASNLGRVVSFWSHIKWRVALPFVLPVLPGTWLGLQLVDLLQGPAMSLLVGLAILSATLWSRYGSRQGSVQKARPWWVFTLIGAVSSVLGMIVGATGPLIAPFFLGPDFTKEEMVGTKAVCQMTVQLIKVPSFWAAGWIGHEHLPLLAVLAFTALLGANLGKRFLGRFSDSQVKLWVTAALLLVSCHLIWTSISEWLS
jgi:uncharacterized membrane protein YfcA